VLPGTLAVQGDLGTAELLAQLGDGAARRGERRVVLLPFLLKAACRAPRNEMESGMHPADIGCGGELAGIANHGQFHRRRARFPDGPAPVGAGHTDQRADAPQPHPRQVGVQEPSRAGGLDHLPAQILTSAPSARTVTCCPASRTNRFFIVWC
jgi:hypothetical protein